MIDDYEKALALVKKMKARGERHYCHSLENKTKITITLRVGTDGL